MLAKYVVCPFLRILGWLEMSLLSDCKIILCKASPIKTKEASLKCGLGTLQVWVGERGEFIAFLFYGAIKPVSK